MKRNFPEEAYISARIANPAEKKHGKDGDSTMSSSNTMTNPKVLGLMGFAAKARKIQTGTNTAFTLIEKGKAKLVIICSDLAENSREKLIRKADEYGVSYRIYGDGDEMSHITGTSGKGVFIITDTGFRDSILGLIDKEV